MKLIVKMATRSRPEKFKTVLQKYIDFLSGENEVRFVITCDLDDETMNNDEMREWFEETRKSVDLVYRYGHSKSKVEACNADLEDEDGDVLLVTSDDMIPAAMNYDSIIAQGFAEVFPNYDGAIKFNDGLRNDALMTLPCLGWKLYKAIGHCYHPDYTSLYCDDEQTRLCGILGKLAVCEMIIARHEWIPGDHENADDLHKRNESYYGVDGEVFKRRAENNFDVDEVRERLGLPVPAKS